MIVQEWLRRAKTQIDALDAELIAVRVFAPRNADRSWLVAHSDEQVDKGRESLAEGFVQRRVRGMPLAYVLGEKEFYGRKFSVQPGVLIPRPETETLIDVVKTLELPKRARFLEIGTGSGCIAITLALEYPQSYVLATDLSAQALDIAERNDICLEGRIELVQSNLFRDLGFDGMNEHFDVVVANLPYVNKDWAWLDHKSLDFEPSMALYANGNNGLSIYQRFFKELYYQQNSSNLWIDYVVVEADPCQHPALIKMAEKAGLVHLRTVGYISLFEDKWRYWLNPDNGACSKHKPKEIIELERKLGTVHYLPEELDSGEGFDEQQ